MFHLTSKNNKISISTTNLVGILSTRANSIVNEKRKDIHAVVEEWTNLVIKTDQFLQLSVFNIVYAAFCLGYVYRIFMEKNDASFDSDG